MGARRWWILVALVVAVLPLVLDLGFVLAALRTMPGGALAAAALPATVALGLPLTHRLDGARPALLAGLLLCLVGSIGEAAADSTAGLIAVRIVVGIGAAVSLPAALRVLQAAFEPAEQLRALSIWAGFTGLALALAPLLGGQLVDAHGWSAVFVTEAPLFAVGIAAMIYLLPALATEKPSSSREFDLRGPAAILLLMVTCVALERHLPWSRAAVGALLLAPFTAFSITARAVSPAVRRFSARRVVVAGIAVMAVSGVALAGAYAVVLVVPLGIGAALVLGAAPTGSAILRTLALAGGFALGAVEPTMALLVGSALCVAAGLLGSSHRRSSDLAPP